MYILRFFWLCKTTAAFLNKLSRPKIMVLAQRDLELRSPKAHKYIPVKSIFCDEALFF